MPISVTLTPSTPHLDIAAQRAALTPSRPAVWFEGRWYTYAELNDRANALACYLHHQGVRQGDRVGILACNHLRHLDLILATAKLGFIYTPLNYRLSLSEQREIIAYIEPVFLFYDGEHQAYAEALGVLCESVTAPLGLSKTALPSITVTPEDIQMILFTGGTSGLPKGAMQSYRQGLANVMNTVLAWGLRDSDCVIQATPCFHAAVNAFTVPLLHLGARIVLMRAFEPSAYLRAAVTHQCSVLFMVPTMYQMLLDAPEFAAADLSEVRWAISGGAPCPEPIRVAFGHKGVPFKQGYGLTEGGVNCFAMELADAQRHPQAIGKPILYTRAVIRCPDGVPVTQGEIGELTLQGDHLFSGYYRHPEATCEALRDGWLWTGDLAYEDDQGFITIAGRRKEMFISGGENVFPTEIEYALYEHPAVSECAVLGVPDDRWGEVGLAVLVLKEGHTLTAAAAKGYLTGCLAKYKVPKHYRVVNTLPKSGAGKILKLKLAQQFKESRVL